jgi:hypothetical protein
MRRVLSGFLLGALVWSFVAPLALALPTSAPASCCRRNGEHHCTSAAFGAANDQQPGIRSVPSCCPYHSQIAARTLVVSLETSRTVAHHIQSEILAVQADCFVIDSCSHSRITQRGPPSEFLHI